MKENLISVGLIWFTKGTVKNRKEKSSLQINKNIFLCGVGLLFAGRPRLHQEDGFHELTLRC